MDLVPAVSVGFHGAMHNGKLVIGGYFFKPILCDAQIRDAVAGPPAACQSRRMRASNFYAYPGFERAGLRRRETEWIRARLSDRESLFVPVWRSQSLIVELDGGEPQAVILGGESAAMLLGPGGGRPRSGWCAVRSYFLACTTTMLISRSTCQRMTRLSKICARRRLPPPELRRPGCGSAICASSAPFSRGTKGQCWL